MVGSVPGVRVDAGGGDLAMWDADGWLFAHARGAASAGGPGRRRCAAAAAAWRSACQQVRIGSPRRRAVPSRPRPRACACANSLRFDACPRCVDALSALPTAAWARTACNLRNRRVTPPSPVQYFNSSREREGVIAIAASEYVPTEPST